MPFFVTFLSFHLTESIKNNIKLKLIKVLPTCCRSHQDVLRNFLLGLLDQKSRSGLTSYLLKSGGLLNRRTFNSISEMLHSVFWCCRLSLLNWRTLKQISEMLHSVFWCCKLLAYSEMSHSVFWCKLLACSEMSHSVFWCCKLLACSEMSHSVFWCCRLLACLCNELLLFVSVI